jgi:hypothetical protein
MYFIYKNGEVVKLGPIYNFTFSEVETEIENI